MSKPDTQALEQALQRYIDPNTQRHLLLGREIVSVQRDGDCAVVDICLAYPAAGMVAAMREALTELLLSVDGIARAQIGLRWAIGAHQSAQEMPAMRGVKNIIAVASGKGGVGKSTTSVNLALALKHEGARVGLLDADIYGPSQQLMLGIAPGQRPQQQGREYVLPVEALGLQTMSMGYLIDSNTPMVWRGPMVSGALIQMLTQTLWSDLDYLIIDMPPGTGDIQLTLSQKVPVAGAVIVTTPQDIALIDARKGIEMFNKVAVPVLGIVENMAIHICSACGHQEHLFGSGGGERIAADYSVPLLGSLPLSLQIREQVDAGLPSVEAEPEGAVAALYRAIARRLAATLALRTEEQAHSFPHIVIKND